MAGAGGSLLPQRATGAKISGAQRYHSNPPARPNAPPAPQRSRPLTTIADRSGVYLKYALFCRETEEGAGDDLTFRGIIDLVDIAIPDTPPTVDAGNGPRILAEVDAHLAFCIAGASPGRHTLEVSIRAPGASLSSPPPQQVEWEEGIFFQRWIKPFRIPVTRLGRHIAAIAFDGMPLGEASFLVRLKP